MVTRVHPVSDGTHLLSSTSRLEQKCHLIRSFGGMFRAQPHRRTSSPERLRKSEETSRPLARAAEPERSEQMVEYGEFINLRSCEKRTQEKYDRNTP